jgi:hypothetical protein
MAYRVIGVIAAGFLSFTSSASAQTGADDLNKGLGLRNLCGNADLSTASFCRGYIYGVVQGLSLHQHICVPAMYASQIVLIVRKYLEDHPERLHLDSEVLVEEAMRSNYHCSAKR